MIDGTRLDKYTLEVLRPRIRFAMKILQDADREIDILLSAIDGQQQPVKRLGRPRVEHDASVQEALDVLKRKPSPAKVRAGRASAGYWATMTKQERSAE